MITAFIMFIAGCLLGWGYHWLHHRGRMRDLQDEIDYSRGVIEALRADNADLVTIIESHKSPWG